VIEFTIFCGRQAARPQIGAVDSETGFDGAIVRL
jgi:hypothetical protein